MSGWAIQSDTGISMQN